jgi:cyclopropane-fatty-acyl-phospholipid synthase
LVTVKQKVIDLLAIADIRVDGTRPWDIQVHDDRFYSRVLAKQSLGLGESYMDGWWDCQALDQFFFKLLRAHVDKKIVPLRLVAHVLKATLINAQSRRRAQKVGEVHYDIGNDLYAAMLGKTMMYTCAYWKGAKTLDQAQKAKMDLVCRKLRLRPGMKVLDIGCGWGGFANYAATKYKARVVGVTISKEQAMYARTHCKGLPVDIRLQDYRDVDEKFDRIVSLGMFEHVGTKNYRAYMALVHRCLSDDGIFLLQTIGGIKSVAHTDPWIDKYIFPNGVLPSVAQIGKAIDGLFVLEDWHSFGEDYDTTLMAWHRNFEKHRPRTNERFHRMWRYYLLCCAGSFRARRNQLWQIVLSKHGVVGGYGSVR